MQLLAQLRTVILNDLHVGSVYAVSKNHNDTREQKTLYQFWQELVKEWKNPDYLILNGDLIDGLAYRANMADTWTTDLQQQADESIELIQEYNPKRIFVVRGTPYHTQTKGVDLEEYIGKELGAVREGKRYSTEIKLINLAPKGAPTRVIHVAHHLNGSKWYMYRGTALSRDMATAMLNETHFIDRKKYGKIWGIIRAHTHYFWLSESASRIMLSCPAWQLPTPFTMKVMPTSPPDIGAVQITCYEDGEYDIEKRLLRTRELMPKVH